MADETPSAPAPEGDHAALAAALPDEVTGYEVLADGTGVTVVTPYGLFQAAKQVRSLGYPLLSLLSAYDGGDHFGVLYAFVKLSESPGDFGELRLRVVMPKKEGEGDAARDVEPVCPSLCDLYAGANWHEREMYDMYGIRFEGHPHLARMFLPEGWKGYPMRKDNKEPEQYVALREGEDIVVQAPERGAW